MTTPSDPKPRLELCRRCLTWDNEKLIETSADGLRVHHVLAYCVARLADRLGIETPDAAITRILRQTLPPEGVFKNERKDDVQ